MRDRLLGPYKGYFMAATCLLMGDLGDQYQGWGKVFDHLPQAATDPGELASVQCAAAHRTVEQALDDAEDELVRIIDSLPERAPPPEPENLPLQALVYVSRAPRAIAVTEIQHLLRRARERNREHGITGMLLYFDETFIQYLEGPGPRVQMIYRVIRRDPLHHGLVKFVHQDIGERVFPDWQMAFEMPGSGLWLPKENRPALRPGLDARTVHGLLSAFLDRQSVRDELVSAALMKSSAPPRNPA